MKVKCVNTLFVAFLLAFFGCDDNTGSLGINMLPSSDAITSNTILFDVQTRSIMADSVFAKTSTGYVGRFTDPNFGYYEASFLSELNCADDFAFPELYQYDESTGKATGAMAGDSAVSAQLVLFYSAWFGDSLNTSRISVYPLTQRLERNRYTNIDPKKYYEPGSKPLGRKTYTAYDTSVPDSVRNATNSSGQKTFYPNITFQLGKEYGNQLLKLNREHPEYFKNSDAFIDNVFKGVYVKSDLGDGTILYIDRVDIQVKFCMHYLDSNGVKLKKTSNPAEDSVYYSMGTAFASTKEVIQANQFLNADILKERVAEKSHTYIKSPAGIFTEATLPYEEISEQLSGDTLNAVRLTFTNYNQNNKYKFSMSAPASVLLLRKQDFKEFFEENQLPDQITSFTVSHNNVATNQYTFNNISRLVTTCLNEKKAAKQKAKQTAGSAWDEKAWETKWNTDESTKDWNKVLLIPVTIEYDTNSQGTKTMTSVQNNLQPGYAKLKGGETGETLKLEVTYTRNAQ